MQAEPDQTPKQTEVTKDSEVVVTPSRSAQPRKHHRGKPIAALILIILLIGVGVAGTLFVQKMLAEKPIASREHPTSDGNSLKTSEETTISTVAEKVSPSVVSIITQTQSSGSGWNTQEQSGSAGSGIIVGGDGYILTNKHVVKGASSVEVVMADGTTYRDVKIVGTDPLNDLAFVKISGVKDLPVAELGDSTTVNIGQHVIAIGNSLGEYQNTVTSGIISGKGRPISAQDGNSVESLTDLLQTDAAINPGNSGGPLLNSSGQVIGINTAIAEDAEGIGFAIPINAAKGILKGVLAGKSVERAYLGVRYIPIDAAIAKQYKLSLKVGAYVYSDDNQAAVVPGSPADKAGIKKGDIIVKVNGIAVGPRGSVASLVAEYAPGDTIALTINRDGKESVVRVTLSQYPTN